MFIKYVSVPALFWKFLFSFSLVSEDFYVSVLGDGLIFTSNFILITVKF